ncbi:transposase [Pontibacter toksunensis]|uniref:Transposase n=1 Tax=Pontibacter toksunensis TaxID=1332631 RepID=A0ABW6C199_9BACT
MKRRHWSADEKLSILSEAEKEGITATIRKHGIYSNTFYQWKEKYGTGGKEALSSKHYKVDPEVKRLQKENQQLKQLLAEKELALRIKEELLKKSTVRRQTGL